MAKTEVKIIHPTPEEVEAKILAYERECKERRVFADEAGMRVAIGLTKSQIQKLCDADEEYTMVFERAVDRRESTLIRRMVTEPKSANGCMNALKQKSNGGYTDKPVNSEGAQTLNINITGGHGAELFK